MDIKSLKTIVACILTIVCMQSSQLIFANEIEESSYDEEENELTVEYGHVINQGDLRKAVKGKNKKKDIDLEVDGTEENSMGYYSVGEYDAQIKAKKMKTKKIKLKIVDTTAPSITTHVMVKKGDTTDPLDQVYIHDLSGYTVTADTKSVNVNQVGDYVISITATDPYGNTNTKDVTFEVWSYTEPTNDSWETYSPNGSYYYKDPTDYTYDEWVNGPCYDSDTPYDYYVKYCYGLTYD